MNNLTRNFLQACQIFGQLVAFSLLITVSAQAQDYVLKREGRAPASMVPSDDFRPEPAAHKLWVRNILAEDSGGVLNRVKADLENWKKIEDYREKWNVESTGLYKTPDYEDKKEYLSRHFLKYLDKRISGEIKGADQGTALHRVNQVQKALKPSTAVKVSKLIKLKFKAKVLQREARLIVDNPWIDYSTEMDMEGQVTMKMGKTFKELGVDCKVDYDVDEGHYVAHVDKKITETISGRVSSYQSDKDVAFSEESNRIFQLMYNLPF